MGGRGHIPFGDAPNHANNRNSPAGLSEQDRPKPAQKERSAQRPDRRAEVHAVIFLQDDS